jgi:hypothetical protein
MIRCLHMMEAFPECKIYMKHAPRMFSPMAVLADHLSRKSTTKEADIQRIRHLCLNP